MTLKELRLARGMTQEDVALELGYAGKSGYNNLENGYSKPSIEQAKKLSTIFECSLDEVIDAVS